jgi:hypothetical protein
MRRFDDTDPCEDTGDAPVSGHNGAHKPWVHDGGTPAPCRPEFAAAIAATREAARASFTARVMAWGPQILAGA